MNIHPDEEKLIAYVHELLSPREKELLREHLSICAKCKRYIDELTDEKLQIIESLQIKPISSQIKERILHALERTHFRGGKRFISYLAMAAGVVILLLGVILFLTPPRHILLEGSLLLKRKGQPWRLIQRGFVLSEGDRLETPRRGYTKSATIRLKDRSTVKIAPQSSLSIEARRDGRGFLIRLKRGEILCRVSPAKEEFLVKTSQGYIRVLGTEFAVKVTMQKGGRDMKLLKVVAVVVLAGTVQVSNMLGQEILEKGKGVMMREDRPLVVEEAKKLTGMFATLSMQEKKKSQRWEEIPEAPIEGRGFGTCLLYRPAEGFPKLIIWGGFNCIDGVLDDGAIYDFQKKEWKEMADSPLEARRGHFSAVVGDKLIIWGGFRGIERRFARGFRPFNDGAIYDIKNDKWKKMADFPLKEEEDEEDVRRERYGYVAKVIKNKLIIWGGLSGYWDMHSDGAIYDIEKDSWREMEMAPLSGVCRGLVYHPTDGSPKLVIVRGEGLHGVTRGAMIGAMYDLEKDAWEEIIDAPLKSRMRFVVAITGDKLLIWGGRTSMGEYLSSGAVYDFKKKKWREMEDCPIEKWYHYVWGISEDKFII